MMEQNNNGKENNADVGGGLSGLIWFQWKLGRPGAQVAVTELAYSHTRHLFRFLNYHEKWRRNGCCWSCWSCCCSSRVELPSIQMRHSLEFAIGVCLNRAIDYRRYYEMWEFSNHPPKEGAGLIRDWAWPGRTRGVWVRKLTRAHPRDGLPCWIALGESGFGGGGAERDRTGPFCVLIPIKR